MGKEQDRTKDSVLRTKHQIPRTKDSALFIFFNHGGVIKNASNDSGRRMGDKLKGP